MFLDNILPPLEKDNPLEQPCYFAMGLDPHDKRGIRQVPCYSHKDLITACGNFVDHGWNSYFAQAQYVSDLRGRRQVNVGKLKAFWADIDVGKEKNSYPTQEAAVAGIATFVAATGLTPTYIVSSGYGFYVYWCLDRAIKAPAWKKLATWLAEVMKQTGLIADPACTTDTARVLRMPGTTHQKSGSLVGIVGKSSALYTVEDIVTKLYAVAPPSWENSAPPLPQAQVQLPVANAALTNPFGQPQSFNQPKAEAQPIVEGCRQMAYASLGMEPSWYAMMTVLRRCVDGHEWAHKLSAMDQRRYVYADTEQKFLHAPEDAPALCSTFEQLDPSLCENCPHKGRIKTPVQLWQLSSKVMPAEIEQPAQPEPASTPVAQSHEELPLPFEPNYTAHTFKTAEYWVDKTGCHWLETKVDKKGNVTEHDHIITLSQLYYLKTVWTYRDGKSERQHWFVVVNPNGHSEHVYLDAVTASSSQQLMGWLYSSNVFPSDPAYGAKVFMGFVNAYLNSILNEQHMIEVSTSDTFGWKEANPATGQKAGFAIGSGLVTPQGMEAMEYAGVASKLAKGLDAKGTLENWKPVAEMYKTLDQKAAQLGVCLSLAAPLMRYGSGVATSATYSIWSTQSGMGKTQLLRACASVWGKPDGQWIQRNASPVARMRQLAVLNNLPAFMDELTDVPDEDLYSLAYSLVGGQEKNKLRRNGVDMMDTGTWNTVTFCTSNKSIKEAVANCSGDSSASVTRVIEYECDFESFADTPEVQAYINHCVGLCAENYGVAGPNFIWHLLQHQDRLVTLTAQIEHWASKNKFANEERFMAYPLALALKAGRWACEWGILDYDMDALEEWVMTVFVPHNRGRTHEQVNSPKSILLSYLIERQRNLLLVEEDLRTSPVPAPGMPDSYAQILPTHADVFLRMTSKEGVLYISKSDLDKWCKRRSRSANNLWRALQAAQISVRQTHKNLGDGVPSLATPIVPCYMIDPESVKRLGFKPEEQPQAKVPANKALTGKLL